MNETVRRAIVALIGAPIVVWVIWLGDAPLATMASALSAIGAWEFYRIARAAGSAPIAPLGIAIAACLPLGTHAEYLGVVRFPLVVAALLVLGVIAATIWLRPLEQRPITAASTTIMGALYTGGTLSFVYALRYHNYAVGDVAGAMAVMLPVLLTWSSDTGAYFTGRLIGGRKLMPSVSPAKTVSGAIGAVVTTVVMCVLFVRFGLRPYAQLAFTPLGLIIFGVGISMAAQIGDLAESLFKREAGAKDSGSLFPGHGGVLDRLDSLFFVLPIAFALYSLLLIPAPTS